MPNYRPLSGSGLIVELCGYHLKYHHGKGETIRAKKAQAEMGRPKVIRIDVVAAQESGSAMAM
jgi:hypothetical protein